MHLHGSGQTMGEALFQCTDGKLRHMKTSSWWVSPWDRGMCSPLGSCVKPKHCRQGLMFQLHCILV